MRYEQAWIQGTWHSLRQATGVKSPGQFEVRHIPILVSEIERILKTAIRLNKFQHNLERDVVRAALRKGQSVDALLDKLESEHRQQVEELTQALNEHLPEWVKMELNAFGLRSPNRVDIHRDMKEQL